MRALILIFMAGNMLAQTNNQKMLDFVEANQGKRVGTGLCRSLVVEAIMTFDTSIRCEQDFLRQMWGGEFGELVDSADAKPGDICLMYNLVKVNGKVEKFSHIAIVDDVFLDGFSVAEQNPGDHIIFGRVRAKVYSGRSPIRAGKIYSSVTYAFIRP